MQNLHLMQSDGVVSGPSAGFAASLHPLAESLKLHIYDTTP
jgi:hypothetical protein